MRFLYWFDWEYPQSAMALHIYRVGRSVPIRSWNPNKSYVKIRLLTRIGHFRPVWPPLDRSDREVRPARSDRRADLLGGIIFWFGLQIGCSTYAFRSARWDLHNGAVQLTIWQTYPNRSNRFLCMRGLTGLPRLSRKLELCQLWVSIYALIVSW